MITNSSRLPPTAVLLSGGLDSCILVGHLLAGGQIVQPLHVRTDLVWQHWEQSAVERFLNAMAGPRLRPLVTFELPLADIYERHWSVTGANVPPADSADEAVFLPGRNALLIVKAAVWCQLQGIGELALAPLGTSPFADASADFFRHLEQALNCGAGQQVRITCPFGQMNKQQVMALGRALPLELTFSCIAPHRSRHCGTCNKCAERRAAFRLAELPDPTDYAADWPATSAL